MPVKFCFVILILIAFNTGGCNDIQLEFHNLSGQPVSLELNGTSHHIEPDGVWNGYYGTPKRIVKNGRAFFTDVAPEPFMVVNANGQVWQYQKRFGPFLRWELPSSGLLNVFSLAPNGDIYFGYGIQSDQPPHFPLVPQVKKGE